MAEITHDAAAVQNWLQTPLGSALMRQEARVVEQAFDGLFGERCLQMGLWGDSRAFLRHARTQRTSLIAENGAAGKPSVLGELHRLPIASDSIDTVLLPHTLDYSDRPHAILREVQRVLRSDGHLVVLGLRPGGLWGLRRLIPGAGLPPGADHLISDRRLRDWLELLDMHIHGVTRYFFRWPLPGDRGGGSRQWEQRGQRWWPELSACYMLTAQKRFSTLTPVRPVWRTQAKVVTGVASPSTRVSRIRFEPNH
ncbi:MAG: methyltransferase domain-containing protein [Proteobacteria bacterium]|nr:methyltransferase domain-containing protein [Pseudomonadota bacterium]